MSESEGATDLTCPVIIMRHGGLDGVALQKEEYFALLRRLDMGMHVISGRQERDYAPEEEDGRAVTIVEQLDFHHPASRLLFANQFIEGPEKEGVPEIGKEEWLRLFEEHRAAIRAEVDCALAATPHNTPVLVYNLLSLRHAQPAAAVALRDLVLQYPNRGFLSHSADPDAERPEKIARIQPWALEKISASEPGEPYDGGPYRLDNLYHIVLNPTQRAGFVLKYDIEMEHVYEIPDFLAFESKEPDPEHAPDPGYLDEIRERGVIPDGTSYRYEAADIDADTVFFLSPVRPVYRKQLKEAMLVANAYGRKRGEKVAFVVTHPDVDDPGYFLETVQYAAALELPYLHLNESRVKGLERAYANLAPLRTVGIVASSAGGWENALNEMARGCIPFVMNAGLNSYRPLTSQMGVRTFGMAFEFLHSLSKARSPEELRELDLTVAPNMTPLFHWIDQALGAESREDLVNHNYRQARRHISYRPTAIRLWEAILKIYARHGLPDHPGEAVEA
jgi:hypothetical protein